MRTNNSIKNSIVSVFSGIFSILIGFIAQKIFITILGAEYLGLNGIFSNIIAMLSIAELGIGEAIIFYLYKPIADNNIDKIKSLLLLYRKAYHIIALIVFISGLCFIPFLSLFMLFFAVFINVISELSSIILEYKAS